MSEYVLKVVPVYNIIRTIYDLFIIDLLFYVMQVLATFQCIFDIYK